MKSYIYAFAMILFLGCGTTEESTTSDMSNSDAGTNTANEDLTQDQGGRGCRGYKAYSIDFSVPCKKTQTNVDLGCLECSDDSCSGLAAVGCFLTTDSSVLLITDTVQEPDPLLQMGWVLCSEKTADGSELVPQDLPLCE